MTILITGANGFVGRALQGRLSDAGHALVTATRKNPGEIGAATDWRGLLPGVEAVVHLAARVHMRHDPARDSLARYREVNTAGTLRLAQQAAEAGVRRLVYLSSVKVNGEAREAPYRETDAPAPQDAYAVSKHEAEAGLAGIARDSGLEIVVLRPSLVYGPGVKANFLSLMRAVERGWPLPFGGVDNRRSLLYLGNLVDAIRVCVEHPAAAGQTFLIDDGEPVSTPQLVRAIAAACGQSARLLPVPVGVLQALGSLVGKRAAIERLAGSLAVDSRHLRATLGWTPPYSFAAGLAATVAAYRAGVRRGQ